MMFGEAVDGMCKCDDGMASLKEPFLHPYLDARAADTRRPMVGAVDLQAECTDDGGVKVVQVTYPLEYEPIGGTCTKVPDPISPLRANTQAADQGKCK